MCPSPRLRLQQSIAAKLRSAVCVAAEYADTRDPVSAHSVSILQYQSEAAGTVGRDAACGELAAVMAVVASTGMQACSASQ